MAELSARLGISQLALVRSALAAFLIANEAPVAQLVAPEVIAEAQVEEATEAQAEETTEAQPEARPPRPSPRPRPRRPPRPSPRPRPQHPHHRQLPKQMPHGLHGIVLSCCRVSPRRSGSPAPSKRILSPDTTNQGRHRDDDSDQHLRSSPSAQPRPSQDSVWSFLITRRPGEATPFQTSGTYREATRAVIAEAKTIGGASKITVMA